MELLIDKADRILADPASRPPVASRVQLATTASRAARGLAAAVLVHPAALDAEARHVEADDLRDAFAKDVFTAVKSMYVIAPGSAVDLADVWRRVAATGRWDKKKLAVDLSDLYDEGGVGVEAGYYVRAVGMTGRAMDLLAASDVIERDVLDFFSTDEIDPAELTGIATGHLDAVTADREAFDPVSIETAVGEAVAGFDARHDPRSPRPINTGFVDIDRIIPGFAPGQLTLVAARPSVGKTALGLSFGFHAASCGHPAYFASLEMSRRDIGERIAFMVNVNGIGPRLRAGKGSESDLTAIHRSPEFVAGIPLFVDDTPAQRVGQIAAAARRMRRRHGLKIILVDYLQLVAPDSRRPDRREQVEEISRGLKRIAREMAVPVVAMAQLNREVEGRTDQKPRLADLREAGGLEQDADVVMLLWRHTGQDDAAESHSVGCMVAKHRNGPTGELSLTYVRASMRFENYVPDGRVRA